MKMILRAFGIGLTVISVFLALFAVTSLYSVLQLPLAFGTLQGVPVQSGVIVALPFKMSNHGFYDLSTIQLTTNLTTMDQVFSPSTTPFLRLSPGQSINTFHNLIVLHNDTAPGSHFLFTDALVPVNVTLSFIFAQAIPVQLSVNFTVPWGAPLANFTTGPLTQHPYNTTHVQVALPLQFENHAVFNVTGTVTLTLTEQDSIITSRRVPLTVPSATRYVNTLDVLVPTTSFSTNGTVSLTFATNAFSTEVHRPLG